MEVFLTRGERGYVDRKNIRFVFFGLGFVSWDREHQVRGKSMGNIMNSPIKSNVLPCCAEELEIETREDGVGGEV